jgi:ubiquinone/menaquinone biosynthesis C-methylase UbiE
VVGVPRPLDHAEDDPGGLQDHRRLVIAPSAYDDELWELVPEDTAPPAHLERFVRSLGPVESALDLGCGDGRLTVSLSAASLVGADVSAVALARARKLGLQTVELTPGAPLPFADNSFDLVLCAETIEHVQDVQQLLSEVRRVLRPRGRLALTTPAHGLLLRRPDPLSPHIRFFTRRSLRGLLERMGFAVESVRRAHGSLMAVATR